MRIDARRSERRRDRRRGPPGRGTSRRCQGSITRWRPSTIGSGYRRATTSRAEVLPSARRLTLSRPSQWLRSGPVTILTVGPDLTAGSARCIGAGGIMPDVYPLVEARGTHRELGRQHGEQCRDRVRGFLDYLGQHAAAAARRSSARRRCGSCPCSSGTARTSSRRCAAWPRGPASPSRTPWRCRSAANSPRSQQRGLHDVRRRRPRHGGRAAPDRAEQRRGAGDGGVRLRAAPGAGGEAGRADVDVRRHDRLPRAERRTGSPTSPTRWAAARPGGWACPTTPSSA